MFDIIGIKKLLYNLEMRENPNLAQLGQNLRNFSVV
jgi:hypothetical protein